MKQRNGNGGIGEQPWWNSEVENHGGTVCWNSTMVMVEQSGGKVEQSSWNSVVEPWNSHGATVWWNNRTVTVEQWNIGGRTV